MSETDFENPLTGRVNQLAGRADIKTNGQSMIQDALDRNGNLLVMVDQLNNRLDTVLDRLQGPRPSGAPSQPESPEGSLHQIAYQQAFMSEKLEETNRLINELEHLLT